MKVVHMHAEIKLNEYSLEGLKNLKAITFDHFNTLQYSTIEDQEDIINPIIRSLKSHIELNEERFLEKYSEQDKVYRKNEQETFIETTLDELIIKALLDSKHQDRRLAEIVRISVDHGLRTRQLSWYPNAKETLHRLKDLGYKLGLICNTHWQYLPENRTEMQQFFDVITLSYEHGYMKPHPSIFHITLKKLNVEPKECLHVGDDPHADILGAKQVGMKTAYIKRNGNEVKADVVIKRLSELPGYLDI